MPFADEPRLVARVVDQLRVRLELMAQRAAIGVVQDAMTMGVPAGEITGPAGRTEWRGDKRVAELRPFPGQAVNVRRARERLPPAANFIPAQIIHEDEQEVRRRRRGGRLRRGGGEEQGERAAQSDTRAGAADRGLAVRELIKGGSREAYPAPEKFTPAVSPLPH